VLLSSKQSLTCCGTDWLAKRLDGGDYGSLRLRQASRFDTTRRTCVASLGPASLDKIVPYLVLSRAVLPDMNNVG
jgi:hypothetical protein